MKVEPVAGLIWRPAVYETAALPLSYTGKLLVIKLCLMN